MTVTAVHKQGSDVWNNAIRTDALDLKVSQDEVRKAVAGKDFVQTRKMGFMFAINKFGGLFENNLNVGDIVDVESLPRLGGNRLVRVVKRAGQAEAGPN
jgi:hypothetical protein